MDTFTSSGKSAVVLLTTGEPASAHEQHVHKHLGNKIAALLGIEFAGRHDAGQVIRPELYVIPDTTLVAPQPTISTDNDLFGLQLGHSLLYDSDRWSVELMGKGGVYHNHMVAETEFDVTNNPNNSFTTYNSQSAISFIGEFQLIARYHLRPNLSLRAGWEMMYLTNIAHAPDQLTFSPDEGRFSGKGDPFYNGALFGLEGYW